MTAPLFAIRNEILTGCRNFPGRFAAFLYFLTAFAGLSSASLAAGPPVLKAPDDAVSRLLLEGDVLCKLGADRAAQAQPYQKADPSGKCPEDLLAIYHATQGGAEELYKQMQGARNGDMSALASALGTLFFERNDGCAAPDLAYDLYRTAKKANSRGTFPGEKEASELLKMAAAAGRMDLEAFLKVHDISREKAAKPYFLWVLAEEASIGGRFGDPDAALVLQLISKGVALPEERASAIRWAYANWAGNRQGEFEMDDHTSFLGGGLSLYAAVGLPESWAENQKARCVSLLERAKQRMIEPLGEAALNAAYKLAAAKSKNLYLPQEDTASLTAAVFFRSQFEQSLRLLEAVFSGFKPKSSKFDAHSMDSFKKWNAAAALKIPAHLEMAGRENHQGVCLAFSDPEELRKVLQGCEAFVEQCASVFKKVSPDVTLETWQSFLVAHVQRDLGEEARALERWDETQSTISANEEKVRRQRNTLFEKESLEQTEKRAVREQLDTEDPEETIAEARNGDVDSAKWAIGYLLKTKPRDALALYQAAKKANPAAEITVEGIGGSELADALKLAADLSPFDLRAFRKKYDLPLGRDDLWDSANDAARGRRFQGEGAELTLQLVLRAGRKNPEVHLEPSNYFKAVREAYNVWKRPTGARFNPAPYRCSCSDCGVFNTKAEIAQLQAALERTSTKGKSSPETVEMAGELEKLERELWLEEKRASNRGLDSDIEAELKAREEDLKALQKGFSSAQKKLFAAARKAADEWIGWQGFVEIGHQGGIRGEPKHAAFNHHGQKEWLKQLEPLLAGYVPSIVYPWVASLASHEVVDILNRESLEIGDDRERREDRKSEVSAWVKYRDHAARFLFNVSPALSEEDWKAWLCEVRRVSGEGANTASELLKSLVSDSVRKQRNDSEGQPVEVRREREEQYFVDEFKRIEAVFKDPRSFAVDLKGVRGARVSQDGKLRIFSWNTETGGTADNYCAVAQYKAPGFGVEYTLLEHPDTQGDPDFRVFGRISQIDTMVTKRGETVYLLWTSARTARTRSTESVFAVSWNQGRLKNTPFFKTKKNLLQSIQVESSFEQVVQSEKTPDFIHPTEENGYTLLVPIISDKYQFAGKFFEYVFDGELFVFKAVR